MAASSYDRVLSEAVEEFNTQGYTSPERLAYWQERLRAAANESLTPLDEVQRQVRAALEAMYSRLVDRGTMLRRHPGVERYTIDRVRPALRAELDRRVYASAELIRLNRPQAVDKTLQRLSGWATSVPPGGAGGGVSRREIKADIKRPLASSPFEVRRVVIDQGHKLTSAINDIVATGGGALAATWNSHWRQANYNYRPDHKERDGAVYLVRGSWAHERGLVKPGDVGYIDAVTRPAEEPFCRCFYTYLYNLRDVPEDMLTAKGRLALSEARSRVVSLTTIAGANA